MSTRAQIIIKDSYSELWFYRHSDGYPEGTLPSLEQFLGYVKDGVIRDNAEQAAGWLILIGANEEDYKTEFPPKQWEVGAYEPCENVLHGDIEYLYTVDLVSKTITYKQV
jgi:hypothetical protein